MVSPTGQRSRKQVWLRDELILALHMYLSLGSDPPLADRQRLSDVLRALPIERELSASPSFRSPSAVNRKLANFITLDPSRSNKGLTAGGLGDRLVWDEFANDPSRLRAAVAAIERNLENLEAVDGSDADPWLAEAPEGRLLTRVHLARERSRKLVAAKKAETLRQTGRLACEACDFDFARVYGARGAGYVECHHRVPVSSLTAETRTQLTELAIVCSNCHRMIHRAAPWLRVEQLVDLVRERGLASSASSHEYPT